MAASAHSWLTGAEASSRDSFEALVRRLLTLLPARGVAIAVLQEDGMRCCARAGHVAPALGAAVDSSSGISGRCLREGRALRCYDTELDPRVDKPASRRLGIRSLAVAPLRADAKVVGIVEVFSDQVGQFDEASLRTLEHMAMETAAQTFVADSASQLQGVERTAAVARPGPQLLVRQETEVPKRAVVALASLDTSLAEPLQFLDDIGKSSSLRWNRFWKLGGALALLVICSAAAIPAARVYLARASHAPALQAESDVSPEIRAIALRAKSGDVAAQRTFADYYAARQSSATDLVKATTWYVVAGIGGDQRARNSAAELTGNLQPFEIAQVQFNVGKMFAAGLGVPRDPVSAYAWFLLAQAAGDVRADTELARLSQSMNAQETAAARQRVAVWLAQKQ
jgi:hypothetical protein